MQNIGKFYINGEWVRPVGSEAHALINPASEAEICKIPMGNEHDVNAAVAAAKAAFPAFSQTTRAERIRLLRILHALYNEAFDEIAALMVEEMGSTQAFSLSTQAWIGAEHFEALIHFLETMPFEERRGDTLLSKEPIGVCALITPWNWPMNQLVLKVVPALAAGCTMIAKPSEFSPRSSLRFAELVHEAGFQPGVYNHLTGYGHVAGEALARHPDVDMVSITGSTRAGIAVARAAAETVKRVSQELGGKSPNIILPDADLEQAVRDGVDWCFVNVGQSCRSPSRLLVPADRMEEAKALAGEAAETYTVGDPMTDVSMGPVVNERQFNHIQSLIQAGIDEGATLVTGGVGRPAGLNRGYYIRPTVFGDVTNDMAIAREEIFGPVLSIIGYGDEAEAIEIANDTVYGLAGYVQSGSLERARRVAQQMRAGAIWINGAEWSAYAPFGGYKQSGNGREQGEWGIDEYLELKSIAGYA
ncbi:MAG: aldehyde dehydrogenase family protein [Alphaproteobacteria bacterium TMED89]|nr:aldehyde dehydrogenase family protein [Rhodospirillaceae bacterium]RPH19556.1 MAG: aldehyde dehydrogenase family protein [Alphaproteobacteria bacterium TMED89]